MEKAKASATFAGVAQFGRYVIGDTFSEANAGLTGRRVGDIAAERGEDPFECVAKIVANDDFRTVLWPQPGTDSEADWAARRDLWAHEDVMLGGSDAGAHLDRMCGAPYPTKFLGDCLRGRKLVPVEEAVRYLTDVPARLFGLRGRGRVEAGYHADVVVFDPATIDAGPALLAPDLPGGGEAPGGRVDGCRAGAGQRGRGGRGRGIDRGRGRLGAAVRPGHGDGGHVVGRRPGGRGRLSAVGHDSWSAAAAPSGRDGTMCRPPRKGGSSLTVGEVRERPNRAHC